MTAPVKLLTAAQVADILSVPRLRIYELIRTRQLSAIRIGRSVRVAPGVLERWIQASGTAGANGKRDEA